MSRMVVLIDSATGQMIDVAGNVREAGRYGKFAGRMLSRDRNPRLDYGYNGGNALEVSAGGNPGRRISLVAEEVGVTGGTLTVAGESVVTEGALAGNSYDMSIPSEVARAVADIARALGAEVINQT